MLREPGIEIKHPRVQFLRQCQITALAEARVVLRLPLEHIAKIVGAREAEAAVNIGRHAALLRG